MSHALKPSSNPLSTPEQHNRVKSSVTEVRLDHPLVCGVGSPLNGRTDPFARFAGLSLQQLPQTAPDTHPTPYQVRQQLQHAQHRRIASTCRVCISPISCQVRPRREALIPRSGAIGEVIDRFCSGLVGGKKPAHAQSHMQRGALTPAAHAASCSQTPTKGPAPSDTKPPSTPFGECLLVGRGPCRLAAAGSRRVGGRGCRPRPAHWSVHSTPAAARCRGCFVGADILGGTPMKGAAAGIAEAFASPPYGLQARLGAAWGRRHGGCMLALRRRRRACRCPGVVRVGRVVGSRGKLLCWPAPPDWHVLPPHPWPCRRAPSLCSTPPRRRPSPCWPPPHRSPAAASSPRRPRCSATASSPRAAAAPLARTQPTSITAPLLPCWMATAAAPLSMVAQRGLAGWKPAGVGWGPPPAAAARSSSSSSSSTTTTSSGIVPSLALWEMPTTCPPWPPAPPPAAAVGWLGWGGRGWVVHKHRRAGSMSVLAQWGSEALGRGRKRRRRRRRTQRVPASGRRRRAMMMGRRRAGLGEGRATCPRCSPSRSSGPRRSSSGKPWR